MSVEWDDLARLAEAATPGSWVPHARDGKQYVMQEGRGSVCFVGYLLDDYGDADVLADAAFIAAANPATILRLIEDNRRLSSVIKGHEAIAAALIKQAQNYNAEADRHASRVVAMEAENEDLTAERDALAARLAAVEALVDEWERVQEQNRKALGELARGTSHLLLDTPGPADFRAALAAPTDTTKETGR